MTPNQGAATLWIPCGLFFIFRLSHFLLEVPVVRMIEYAVCYQRFSENNAHRGLTSTTLDESACKTASVQSQVSSVLGWRISFDSLPGMSPQLEMRLATDSIGVLSVLYYGNSAEKYGHCNVLTVCCIGYTLALLWTLMTCFFHEIFPVEAVWLAACFLLLGGGSLVFNSMMTSFMVHLSEAQSRPTRLFILAGMPHVAKLVSPPIAAALLARSIYLPSLVSGVLNILCAVLLQVARHWLESQDTDADAEIEPLLSDESSQAVQPMANEQNNDITAGARDVYTVLKASWYMRYFLVRACKPTHLKFACLVFFLSKNALISENFMFQYLSERFGWQLRNTTVLRFTWSSGALAATMVLAPLISTTLTRNGIQKSTIGLGIVRVSSSLLIICFVAAWRTSKGSLFILCMLGAGLGQGLDPALQALLSAGVPPRDTGRLFSYMYMGILLGDTTGGPFMSKLMSIGRSAKSTSHGYNFLASAIMFSIIGMATFKNPFLKKIES